MKSQLFNRYYIECDCGSPNHLLVFDIDEDDYSITAYFSSNYKVSWYKKLWLVTKFVLFEEIFCCYDTVLIDNNNIEQLEKAIKAIKKLRKEKQK